MIPNAPVVFNALYINSTNGSCERNLWTKFIVSVRQSRRRRLHAALALACRSHPWAKYFLVIVLVCGGCIQDSQFLKVRLNLLRKDANSSVFSLDFLPDSCEWWISALCAIPGIPCHSLPCHAKSGKQVCACVCVCVTLNIWGVRVSENQKKAKLSWFVVVCKLPILRMRDAFIFGEKWGCARFFSFFFLKNF